MPDTTGRIRAKALDTTGMTEAMLDKDWSGGAGRTRMAVVELRTVEPHGPNLDGKKRIDYVIESIEPVPPAHEERVREFQRGLFLARPEVEGQAVLSGTAGEASDALDAAASRSARSSCAMRASRSGSFVPVLITATRSSRRKANSSAISSRSPYCRPRSSSDLSRRSRRDSTSRHVTS